MSIIQSFFCVVWHVPCMFFSCMCCEFLFVCFYIPCLFGLDSLFYLEILIVYLLLDTCNSKTFFWFLCFGFLLQFSNCICISDWVLFNISMCLLILSLPPELSPSFPSIVSMCFLWYHSVIYSTDDLSPSFHWAVSLSPF